MLLSLLGPRALGILSDAMFLGACFVTLYGLVKGAYARRMGRPLDTRATRWLDIGVDVFSNLPGALNKAQVARGEAPLLPHPDVASAQAEIARLRALLAAATPALAAEKEGAAVVSETRPLRAPTLPYAPDAE